jgi:hypothetical protein
MIPLPDRSCSSSRWWTLSPCLDLWWSLGEWHLTARGDGYGVLTSVTISLGEHAPAAMLLLVEQYRRAS